MLPILLPLHRSHPQHFSVAIGSNHHFCRLAQKMVWIAQTQTSKSVLISSVPFRCQRMSSKHLRYSPIEVVWGAMGKTDAVQTEENTS